ncbi:penicillin-binding transpeptidase domain-containing protein [Actinocrispum sp. NPDC049592]|uniref:penicillin-binding transpeptidase domain-containing protein n=1 Tax=Actinocrispum sp. NPDC049592 TaxID=3154835 RepID=UPI003440B55F
MDRKAQELAEGTLAAATARQPDSLREAMVAIDPASGAVLVYAGYDKQKPGNDYANSWYAPGSLYMPFVLAALLQRGEGLDEVYDGRGPRKFGDLMVTNAANCAQECTVADAMKQSVNTVFADITFNTVGTRAVGNALVAAGIPASVGPDRTPVAGESGRPPSLAVGLGGAPYQARVVDIATAYATLAAEGTKHRPHLVAQVTDPKTGEVIFDDNARSEDAFEPKDSATNKRIARNITESLLPIPPLNQIPCQAQHQCAGKPATIVCQGGNATCGAWMAGYTPGVSVAVHLGADEFAPIPPESTGLAGAIWQRFLNAYLTDRPAQRFPPYEPIRR